MTRVYGHTAIIWVIRVIVLVLFLSLLYWLISKEFAFGGTLTHALDFKKPSPVVLKLVPDGRVLPVEHNEVGEYFQKMVIDPVYFEINIPRRFSYLDFELIYEAHEATIIELGIQEQPNVFSYQLQPLQNHLLDQLEWESFKKGEMMIYQKDSSYTSVQEILERKTRHNIVTYHVDLADEGIEEMNVTTNMEEIDIVIAKYTSPRVQEGRTYAKTRFDLDPIGIGDDKTIRFMISSPQLDIRNGHIDIHNIQVTFVDPHDPANPLVKSFVDLLATPYETR